MLSYLLKHKVSLVLRMANKNRRNFDYFLSFLPLSSFLPVENFWAFLYILKNLLHMASFVLPTYIGVHTLERNILTCHTGRRGGEVELK